MREFQVILVYSFSWHFLSKPNYGINIQQDTVQTSSSIPIYFCHIVANVTLTRKSSLCVGENSPTVLLCANFVPSLFLCVEKCLIFMHVHIINEVSVALYCCAAYSCWCIQSEKQVLLGFFVHLNVIIQGKHSCRVQHRILKRSPKCRRHFTCMFLSHAQTFHLVIFKDFCLLNQQACRLLDRCNVYLHVIKISR